jgi:hypothetical protein
MDKATVSTAITVLELTAASGQPLEIMRAWATQVSVTTSAQCEVAVLRKTATITGTATPPAAVEIGGGGDTAASFTVKHIATAEGTDGDILYSEGINSLNGFLYIPTPEERPVVPGSGIIALKFVTAPTSASWRFGFTLRELA